MSKQKKTPEIAIVKHKSAQSLVIDYFRNEFPNLTNKEILEEDTEFTVFLDERWNNGATVRQLLRTVRKVGAWGFCDNTKDPKEIHYWISKKACTEQVLELFAHEMAHAIGNKSEAIAKKYAVTALFSYHVMKYKLKWKKW